MAKATTNTTDLSYVVETVAGTTPATPAFNLLPTVSNALALQIQTEVSQAIRADRQTDDLIPVDGQVQGDINFELSYAPFKPFLQELLRPDDGPSDTVVNGSATPTTYTFLKRVIVDGVTYYFYYPGCVISQMKLNFAVNTRLTGTMTVIGQTETATTTEIVGSTYVDPPDYVIMNSIDNISEIAVDGSPSTMCFQNLELTINNNSTGSKCIGVFGNSDVNDFAFDVNASVTGYFEDLSTYNNFKNASDFSLAITLTDSLDNELVITMPKIKYEELSLPIDGRNQYLNLPGKIRALRDSVTGYTIQFAFTDAVA